MNKHIAAALLSCAGMASAHAQGCEGGLYLNPQVIRGEGASQTESALRELIDFLKPTGLSVTPVLNTKDAQDVLTAVKRPSPPCWIYGNPVVGLASGYKPLAVNTDPIQSAVLLLTDIGTEKDGKPVEIASLPAAEQARIRARLKATSCFGMKSGVTTQLVKAEGFCGKVEEVVPQQGLGQSYLPTKAAFHWQADRWVGLITRLQSAQAATMKNQNGTDERIHLAKLVIVPASNSSWGYGLYVRPEVAAETQRKAATLFTGLKTANPLLLKALDLGKTFEYATPADAVVEGMRRALAEKAP